MCITFLAPLVLICTHKDFHASHRRSGLIRAAKWAPGQHSLRRDWVTLGKILGSQLYLINGFTDRSAVELSNQRDGSLHGRLGN